MPERTICERCGAEVIACKDHNSNAATVVQKGVGPVFYDGALVMGTGGTIYAVPAQMVQAGQPLYEWHDLDTSMEDWRTHHYHLVPNIRCGQVITHEREGFEIASFPLRWPELAR